jgi:hypothetical protein
MTSETVRDSFSTGSAVISVASLKYFDQRAVEAVEYREMGLVPVLIAQARAAP